MSRLLGAGSAFYPLTAVFGRIVPWPALVLPVTWALLAAGVWLTWRTMNRQYRLARAVLWVQQDSRRGRRPRRGVLLIPVLLAALEMFSQSTWLRFNGPEFWLPLALLIVVASRFPPLRPTWRWPRCSPSACTGSR